MVNRMGRREMVQVINVVRRDAQVELLKAQGATVVLNSSDLDFDRQLHNACHQYDAHLAFDAVAGTMTGQLLKALPDNSTVTVYSCLSQTAPQTHVDEIIFQGKTITGFWLGPWLYSNKSLLQILMFWRRSQKLIGTDLRSEIRARYPLQEARKAVQEYANQLTGGKILLTPTVG
jgi:NADPH:quinone reductase-like Zn-dependent oxidoreductase